MSSDEFDEHLLNKYNDHNKTYFKTLSEVWFHDPSLQLDEIEPCDVFDQTTPLEALSCWHHDNAQLLPSKINNSKGTKHVNKEGIMDKTYEFYKSNKPLLKIIIGAIEKKSVQTDEVLKEIEAKTISDYKVLCQDLHDEEFN